MAGVPKGHYNDTIENARDIVRELNSGLGMVTTCYLLREILDGDEAKKQRIDLAKKDKFSSALEKIGFATQTSTN